MSRLQWPDSIHSPSEIPGTIHEFESTRLRASRRRVWRWRHPADPLLRFTAELPADDSRLVVPDETTETLIRTFVSISTAGAAPPLVSVFDRPKTVALRWGRDGVVTEWNPTSTYTVRELGVGVDLCWPY